MQGLIASIIVLALLLIGVGAYVHHQHRRVDAANQRADEADRNAAVLSRALADAELKETVVTEYVDRVQVIRERGATITKEVPVYVTQQADAHCTVPAGFVSLHNQAAQNLPATQPTGDPDAPAPGVELSTVAATVSDNYTICHHTAAQLIALQDYLRGLPAAEAR
ncbi:MAG: hypothetical protein Q4G62_01655 [Pseudomonadota bacterium]|nr:hypothetical protein [Pseudomonadota bacterium]